MTAVMFCNGLLWTLRGRSAEALGFLPDMLDATDPKPAREQFDMHYSSYWQPGAATSTTMGRDGTLLHPGDPPLPWVASTRLRDELVLIYPHDFVAVVAADGSFVMQRMD